MNFVSVTVSYISFFHHVLWLSDPEIAHKVPLSCSGSHELSGSVTESSILYSIKACDGSTMFASLSNTAKPTQMISREINDAVVSLYQPEGRRGMMAANFRHTHTMEYVEKLMFLSSSLWNKDYRNK